MPIQLYAQKLLASVAWPHGVSVSYSLILLRLGLIKGSATFENTTSIIPIVEALPLHRHHFDW